MRESLACRRFAFKRGRRIVLKTIGGALTSLALPAYGRAQQDRQEISLGLTPVFLNDDLDLLSALKSYLEASMQRPVKLVLRRTYQEITTLLVSGQLEAAGICGYPFVAFRDQLSLLATPVWEGRPLYQSYLISGASSLPKAVHDLRGSVHAFSDPDSNSGYLVTAALLAREGLRPESFFSRVFFTYGHRNVVRAVASGLAECGSVDGYVWEVLKEIEPELTQSTHIVRKSDWLGFPPIASTKDGINRPEVQALQQAFVSMAGDEQGQRVLRLLRLDGFAKVSPDLFDSIAAKADLVRSMG